MRKLLFSTMFALATVGAMAPASACAPDTVALLETVPAMKQPPAYRCGSDFNTVLTLVHKRDWKGALAAYEQHLSGFGKWQAGSADAKATLAYLREKAARHVNADSSTGSSEEDNTDEVTSIESPDSPADVATHSARGADCCGSHADRDTPAGAA